MGFRWKVRAFGAGISVAHRKGGGEQIERAREPRQRRIGMMVADAGAEAMMALPR